MDRLCYATLEKQNYEGYLVPRNAPIKVLQFGEGNFMRAFVDAWLDMMNEKGGFNGRIRVVTPIAPTEGNSVCSMINEQDGLYTLYLQGREQGTKVRRKRIISSVSSCMDPYTDFETFLSYAKEPSLRFLTSNTTEAGIQYDPQTRYDQNPPSSYPGKLCRFLHERWKNGLPGFIILACELIDHNGEVLRNLVLRHCVEWGLETEFCRWVKEENLFCSTLVDRIVPGYPKKEAQELNQENGYEDRVMDTGEIFGFWVIEGPQSIKEELPIEAAGLENNILVVADHTPYKQRKVRILNGAHTAFVPGAYLAGQNIVRECMGDEVIRGFMNRCIYDEIIPTLTLPRQELLGFASEVVDRFQNPFVDHELLSICLNSTSKWRTRILPSVKEFVKRQGQLPDCLTASFALYISFYHRGREWTSEGLMGERDGTPYVIKDAPEVLEFYYDHRNDSLEALAAAVCGNESFWGEDLRRICGFEQAVSECLAEIEQKGAYEVMKALL